jgi:hypothetical protein
LFRPETVCGTETVAEDEDSSIRRRRVLERDDPQSDAERAGADDP